MSSVKRVYVEKKPEYAVQAKALKSEMKSYLGIKNVENVRVLIRYDIENISDATFETACNGIFSEPPVDTLYKESFDMKEGRWLGPYGYNTLLKSPVFPMFLATICVLKLPYIFSVTICYIVASCMFVYSMKDVIKNKVVLIKLRNLLF